MQRFVTSKATCRLLLHMCARHVYVVPVQKLTRLPVKMQALDGELYTALAVIISSQPRACSQRRCTGIIIVIENRLRQHVRMCTPSRVCHLQQLTRCGVCVPACRYKFGRRTAAAAATHVSVAARV